MFDQFGSIDFEPDTFIATILAFIIAVTIHEFMHAWTAYQLGDTTAASQGRVTLNPASHLDPIGFFMMILLALGIGVIAWGRPVPVNINRMRGGKWGYALTAIAGPASNLVLATVLVIPFRYGNLTLDDPLNLFFSELIFLNLLLTAFNMVPIPPLDGSKILAGILPNFWFPYMARLDQYGIGILILLIILPGNILAAMYGPVLRFLLDHVVGSAFS